MEREFTYNSSSSVTAFDSNGREICLPRNGRVPLPAGSFVKNGQEFTCLEHDCVLVKRTRQVEYRIYHDDYLEEMT